MKVSAVCLKQPACHTLQLPTSSRCMEPLMGASKRLPPFSLCRDLKNVIGARSTLSAKQQSRYQHCEAPLTPSLTS